MKTLNYCASILGSTHAATVYKKLPLPIHTTKRHLFDFSPFQFHFPISFTANNVRSGDKEVYLLANHLRYHKEVPRKDLVKSLKSKVQSIKGNETKVIYIVGLPGIGKKELARQYAEQHYKRLTACALTSKKTIFVAALDMSDPMSFHQHLFKIAETLDIIENYEQYCLKTEKPGGYKEILHKLSSRLKERSDWLLVLNDLKFSKDDLRWRVGQRYDKKDDEINKALQDLDLCVDLPSPGDPSNGTIIITTCDGFAKRHSVRNVECFDMPIGMSDDEALQLLEFASGQQNLQQCESAKKVIRDLQNVPTSVYW